MGLQRAPDSQVAKERRRVVKARQVARKMAASATMKFRRSGGYGKKFASCWEPPSMGIESSPAYRFVVSRCGIDPLPEPEDRDGAPVKGGLPFNQYPPNLLVDGQRAYWLPDDWAQVVKNTGPGGTYVGWLNPGGKFFYHRHGYPTAIEESLGRVLTAVDGFNGIMRSVGKVVTEQGDKDFLETCLTSKERRNIVPVRKFHFAVISARRATSPDGIHNIMVVEAHFRLKGVRPTWYVDEASHSDYEKLGLRVKVGGKLTPARNKALEEARRQGCVCVQVSDDISKWEYYNVAQQDFRGKMSFKKANEAVKGIKPMTISPVCAAQFILAKMRSSNEKPKLGGVFPTLNAALSLGAPEFSTQHFILGDFFVVELSPCRFDESMTLKEDYDYTCSHLQHHGHVLRCNRMFAHARHATNKGGAVAIRDSAGAKEKLNISILMKKWPGAFCLNGRRKHEVVLSWKRCKTDPCRAQSTTKTFEEHKCLKLSGASKLGKGKSVKPIKHLKSNGHTGQMRQTHLKQRSLRCRAVVKR
ncbi:Hypothetical protein SCF082_LOCUS29859 [Durusdinium trenchii]|uniref:Uncharacterized protein n=1 Tax=Durusdinium trenchii TaxID=1381693 RepID=A0ABP0MVK7_9DINO